MKSDKWKYIYVHIPKCAGSSIEKTLLEAEGVEYSHNLAALDGEIRRRYLLGGERTHSSLELIKHFAIMKAGDLAFEDYFKYTFVRNPWDRVVSEYEYCKAGGMGNELIWDYDFTEFCHKLAEGGLVVKTYSKTDSGDYYGDPGGNIYKEHLLSQSSFVSDDIDFVGRVENIQNDFNLVCRKVGLPEIELPHTNKTIRSHYSNYYTVETRKLVEDVFGEDIANFSYTYHNEDHLPK